MLNIIIENAVNLLIIYLLIAFIVARFMHSYLDTSPNSVYASLLKKESIILKESIVVGLVWIIAVPAFIVVTIYMSVKNLIIKLKK